MKKTEDGWEDAEIHGVDLFGGEKLKPIVKSSPQMLTLAAGVSGRELLRVFFMNSNIDKLAPYESMIKLGKDIIRQATLIKKAKQAELAKEVN